MDTMTLDNPAPAPVSDTPAPAPPPAHELSDMDIRALRKADYATLSIGSGSGTIFARKRRERGSRDPFAPATDATYRVPCGFVVERWDQDGAAPPTVLTTGHVPTEADWRVDRMSGTFAPWESMARYLRVGDRLSLVFRANASTRGDAHKAGLEQTDIGILVERGEDRATFFLLESPCLPRAESPVRFSD